MRTPHQSLRTTQIVARALALLSGKIKALTLALALMAAVAGPTPGHAQCPPGWQALSTTPSNPGVNGTVNATLMWDPDGPAGSITPRLVVGGNFTLAGNTTVNNIALYDPATGQWSALGLGIRGGINPDGTTPTVHALTTLPNGDLVVGGKFTIAGNGLASNIARWNGSTWSALGTGITGTATVYALTSLPNGELFVGGSFNTSVSGPGGGFTSRFIARWNGSAWFLISLPSVNGAVYALKSIPSGNNGSVIVGGRFTSVEGYPANKIALWNNAQYIWYRFGTGVGIPNEGSPEVRALATLPSGDIIAGGKFDIATGVSANNIARWNGSAWSPLGSGVGNSLTATVYALTLLPNGDIIAGGDFITAGSVSVNRIARWNGSDWSALGTGVSSGTVYSLATLPDGDIIVAGQFTTVGGVAVNNIARYKFARPAPTITTQPVSATVCSDVPATFSVVPSGTGPFTYQWRFWGEAINTTTNPSAATATLTLTNLSGAADGPYDCVVTTPCGSVISNVADLTVISCGCENNPSDVAGAGQSIGGDGQLTADDIIVFQNWYFANISNADIAGAGQSIGSDGQFTADDLIVFFNRFFAGC
jgi:hypothetical protein